MEKRAIIAIVLSILVLILYQRWTVKQQPTKREEPKEIEKIEPLYLESKTKLDEQTKIMLAKKENKEAVEDFYDNIVRPLEIQTTHYILNLRYYSLSALSLRRFVLSRIYVKLKSSYISDLNDPVFINFLNVHQRIVEKYEKEIAEPYLVKADI